MPNTQPTTAMFLADDTTLFRGVFFDLHGNAFAHPAITPGTMRSPQGVAFAENGLI
jgi:hypothetical protein